MTFFCATARSQAVFPLLLRIVRSAPAATRSAAAPTCFAWPA